MTKLTAQRIPVANRLRCECGSERFLIDTTGVEKPDGIINLVECSKCHFAYVMYVETGTHD